MDNQELKELDIQLKYFKSIVKYLDNSGNLDLIQAQASKFNKEKGLVFTFKLLVDPADIMEENASLGNMLLCQPVQASRIFQEVIYKTILVLQLLYAEVSLSQVAVILRFSSVPVLFHMNVIESVACLSRVFDAGICCKMVGMVTGTSAVSKYTVQGTFAQIQIVRVIAAIISYVSMWLVRLKPKQSGKILHAVFASQDLLRKNLKGLYQMSPLWEWEVSQPGDTKEFDNGSSGCPPRCSGLQIKVVAEVIPQKVLTCINSCMFFKSRGQVIPVYVRDDLTKVVEIGEVFEIIGTVRKDITDDNITLMMEANNILKVIKKVTMQTLLQNIPRNVLKLYKDRKSSPWSFVLTLGYLFGGDIFPAGSYFNLKLLLLLSLMSNHNKKVRPLHILVIGADTEPMLRLLQFGMKFKDYNSLLTAYQGVSGRVTLDKYKSAPYFLEGGVLHLSQNGVCYVGDVGRLKKSTTDQLQHALSGSKIVTTVGSKYTEGLLQHIEEKLCSRVWGYTDTSFSNKISKPDDIFLACDTGNITKPLLESFSMLCFVDSGDLTTNLEIQEKITVQIIQSAIDREGSEIPITTEDFHKFLRFAERLDPSFTKEAETLLQSYFLASRKSRMSDRASVPLSLHSTLLSLAYSHAKLALRSTVTLDDALMAIKLCEESLTARFGFSVLSVQPIPHVSSVIMSSVLGPENDKMMLRFHKNLLKYCSLASGLEE